MKYRSILITSALSAALSLGGPAALGQETGNWQWGAELYFWGANLDGRTITGDDIELDIDQIVKDLKFGAMGAVAARKNDLTLFADVIYLDVGDSNSTNVDVGGAPVEVDGDIDLKGVISTFGLGQRVYDQGNTSIDVTGGIRYLWLQADIGLEAAGLSVSEAQSGTNIDGVVGFRGTTDLNEDWYLSYYADIGTGQSDFTWQALGAVNYRFERVDVAVGYRYLDWKFNDFDPFDDLSLHGAFAGLKFAF